MWALIVDDRRLHFVERETPAPGVGDVLVEVRSAGVNAADLMQREGFYPAPPGSPVDIPGMELAGVVTLVGSGVDEKILGRRVAAIVGGGAQATHCVVASEHLLFVPDDVPWAQAGGFPEAFTTAFDALVTQGRIQSSERVVVSGAAGGVGVAGVQIAHALGAHVIALTRTSKHHERLRSLGAAQTLTMDEVSSIERVDVVLELVGAKSLDLLQRRLNSHARVVVIGVGAGSRVELDLLNVMTTRSTITGSTLRSRSREEKAEVARLVNAVLVERWAAGELSVPLAKTFAVRDGSKAYEFFARPGKFGKVVLLNDD